jgi:SAM-dependent methyltransferase
LTRASGLCSGRVGGIVSRWYRFAYRIGFTPWESDASSMIPQFDQLLALVEETRTVPLGSALDLGCGTGRWSVRLAERGWQVVGVDVVPRAIDAARNRSQQAGVDVTFKNGDVTALRAADVGSNFNLLLDMECFNWLSDSDRSRMAQEVDAVAAPDATLLLLVWARARRGPLPRGADRQGLESTFPGWGIIDEHPYEGVLPRPLKSIDPRWYRLQRLPPG